MKYIREIIAGFTIMIKIIITMFTKGFIMKILSIQGKSIQNPVNFQ